MRVFHRRVRKFAFGTSLLGLSSMPMFAIAAPMLEEVIVTGQKRSESTQDTPVAITGMTADSLEKFGFASANDISAQVPNMQVSGPFGEVQPIFAIRGVSMSDYSSNQASPIGVYSDESYMGAVYTHGMNFFDVERLEVLRGPQGTLYGKNTTGGAINIITKTPLLNDGFHVNAKLGAGNYDSRVGDLGVEGTLVEDALAARLAYSFSRNSGYIENRSGGPNLSSIDFQALRLTLNWQITENISNVLKLTHGQNDSLANASRNEPRGNLSGGDGVLGVGGIATGGLAQGDDSSGFIDNTGYSASSQNLGHHEVEDNFTGPLVVNSDMLVNKLEFVGDSHTFTSITSISISDYAQKQNTDGSPEGLLEIRWAVDTDAYSQDLRISSNYDGMFNFIGGIYYAVEEMDMHNEYAIYETPPDLRVAVTYPGATGFYPYLLDFGQIDQKMITDKTSYAAYTQLRFDVTANFGIDFGIRYTVDEIDLTYLNISREGYDGSPRGTYVPGNTTQFDEPFVPLNLAGNAGIVEVDVLLENFLSGQVTLEDLLATGQVGYTHGPYTTESSKPLSAKEQEFTGKLGFDYRFSDDFMMYLSYSKGFRSGNFNGGVYYRERDFEDAYARPEYIDAYEIGFKSDFYDQRARVNAAAFLYDYKDQQFINVVGVSNFLENAGGSTIAGLEAEIMFAATEKLMLMMGIGYLETEYTELELSDTQTLNNPNDTVDLSGNELISAPKISGNISVDYEVYSGDRGYLSWNVNANYQDKQWYSAYNDIGGYENIKQDAYALVNTRLTWRGVNEDYSVSLWAKNLAQEEYDGYAINLQAGFGFDYFQAGPPRTFGMDATYKF
ncbi:TonB-dependent receptor [Zhongshania aquimaris]|nr:TonB-dependent receptor [Zhongshania aquimaris]